MGTSLRPRSHSQRLAAIDVVKAHLDGPAPDPEVRQAFDTHLAGSLPAYLAAYEGHKPLHGKEKESRAAARAAATPIAVPLRLVASGIRTADGRRQASLVRDLLGAANVERVLHLSLRRQVTLVAAFVARIEGRTDLQILPNALASLKEAVALLAEREAAHHRAWMARITAGRTLAESMARFDHDYARFVDRVAATASREVLGNVLVRFVTTARRKKAEAAPSAETGDVTPKLRVRAVAVPIPG